MKQVVIALFMLVCLIGQAGCDVETHTANAASDVSASNKTEPIFSGTQALGSTLKLWTKPVDTASGSNSAWIAPEGSYVEVYEGFIVITSPDSGDGLTRISQHGYYSGLAITKD